MSTRLWQGKIILKDHGSDVDLSKKWIVIEYEDGAPQNVVLTINAKGGRYITQSPKIQKWDRLYVELTDQLGNIVKDVFWVNVIKKIRKKGQGLNLVLYCSHQSSNLYKQTISKPNRRSSGKDAMNDIINQLNANRGSSDPTIEIPTFNIATKVGNNLDPGTTNDYIFESVKAKTAIDEIIHREGTPVEVGGSFQFHYFRFKSKYNHSTGADLDTVQLQVFQQGFMDNGSGSFTNVPQVTLTKPLLSTGNRANTLELDSDLEVETGTNIIAIGNKAAGTYPIDHSRFGGAKQVWQNATLWVDSREYIIGTLVTWENGAGVYTYECILDHTSSSSNNPSTGIGVTWVGPRPFTIEADWVARVGGYTNTTLRVHNDIGYKCIKSHAPADSTNEPPNDQYWVRESWMPVSNYSPLTNNKAQHWINAMGGSKYSEDYAMRDHPAVVDPTVIIQDKLHPRTWVDAVEDSYTALLLKTDLLKSTGSGSKPFDGLRVLCVDPSTGSASSSSGFSTSGNDPNGVAYAGNVIEYRDPSLNQTGQWYVFKDASQDDFEVYDFEEGDSWVHNPCSNVLDFVDVNGDCKNRLTGFPGTRSTVWEKGAYRLVEQPAGSGGTWSSSRSFECVHNVKWDSGNSRIDMGNEQLGQPNTGSLFTELGSTTSAVFIKFNPQDVLQTTRFAGLNFAFPWPRQNTSSSAWGGSTIGETIENPTFDLDNMHLTHNLNREWYGPEVEDFYPIQGFGFMEFFREQLPVDVFGGSNAPKRRGDYPMVLWLADRNDVVITMDYTHSHNNEAFPQAPTLASQKIFRAVPGISAFVPAQAPEILDVFDFRNVIRGGIYTRESFDGQHRPILGTENVFTLANELKLSVDAFRMIKPLVCTNSDEPNAKDVRNIEPAKFQWGKISNYAQLKNYTLAQAAISGFRTDRYEIKTPGRCNVAFGDPVYYHDPEAIDETTNSLTNTVRATANKITYSLSKGADGEGGFIRTIDLVTRLYPDETP